MKRVDILTSLPMNSSIGPVQTIRRIENSKDFFLEKGFEINVFSREDSGVGAHSSKMTSYHKHKWSRKISEMLVHWLSRNTVFWPRKVFKHSDDCARKMLEKYVKLNRHPDVVVFHFMDDCYRYLKDYKIDGTKVAYFEHDDGTGKMSFFSYPKAKGSSLEKEHNRKISYIMENIDVKCCITHTTERNLLQRFPCLRGKTFLVINGISDLSKEEIGISNQIRLKTDKPPYRFISTGSMNGRKGHREIIEALHRIKREKLNNIKMTFLGGGSERASLEKLVEKYNLKEIVEFVGVVENKSVYKYQAESNIAILISKIEGLPLALLEGMRNSLALVSTNVSGIPEIIENGVNGLLIEPDVDSIVEVFDNLEKYDWKRMGKESRKKFEEYYNFPRMRDDYINMLNFVLK